MTLSGQLDMNASVKTQRDPMMLNETQHITSRVITTLIMVNAGFPGNSNNSNYSCGLSTITIEY